MGAFQTPVDIGNRAAQHCGQSRIDPVLGFTEKSKTAREIGFAYDKQREAELTERLWTFATRRVVLRAIDTNTMLLRASLWSPVTTYFVGSIVSDQYNNFWISRHRNNLNNDPLLTTAWDPYFGPLTVSLYDSTIAYVAGEVVYTTPGDGTALVYLSLQSGNTDAPGTATAFDATVTYTKNQVVTFSSVAYMSLIDFNAANTPSASPAAWAVGTTYGAAAAVMGSDGVKYTSIAGGNIGNDPTVSPAQWTNTGALVPWTTVFVGGTGSLKWLLIGGSAFPAGVALTTLNIVYPLGAGPSSQSSTSNAFHKPAGYLRLAPQNPKPGINNLGGPSGNDYNDWLMEGEYIVTSDVGPLVLRFVANFTDVSRMPTPFCEGVAARIAFAVGDSLTQDKGQLDIIAKTWAKFQSTAKTLDGIENAFIDPPEDELISVRR